MRSPHLLAMSALLDKGQFDACRMTAQQFIEHQMEADDPNDPELAHLHLILSRALLGQHEYALAAEKADVAVFLARKTKDDLLAKESLFYAGTSYGRSTDYTTAIRRFTDCLSISAISWQADAYFGRGLCYDVLGAHSYAAADYSSALQTVPIDNITLRQRILLNLAWVLIVQKDFSNADSTLSQMETENAGKKDLLLQAQIAHDRIHMAHLKGENHAAFLQAIAALSLMEQDYPHVRAHVAMTLMSMLGDTPFAQQAFTLGVLAKRLAGVAGRPDLDDDASRSLQMLQCRTGSDSLTDALAEMRQVLPGAIQRRKPRNQRSGGVS